MEEKIIYDKIPKVLVLATDEFYPNYEIAFKKLDTILGGVKESSQTIMVMTDSTLKATKLIRKYIDTRKFLYYLFVPNKLRKDFIWKKSYKLFITKAVTHLVIFYYKDVTQFSYAIIPAQEKGIPIRLIDLSLYE